MSVFPTEEINEQLVDELVELVRYIANTNKYIVEKYKAVYGNTWPSTTFDYAILDLKTEMLSCPNNRSLVDGFTKATDELREDTGKNGGAPTHKEILKFFSRPSRNLFLNKPDSVQKTYTFVEELGHGQTGKVDKVVYRNDSFERFFARKTCETIGDLDRFAREIQTLAKLNHSGIVSIIDAEFTPETAWYLMELIVGPRLCDYEGGFWEKHQIISNLLESVAYLHENDIIHRDLKPENIMIRESDGRPVIVDFGSSYSRLYSTLTTKNVGQTVGYFGPEIQADPDSSRLPQNDIFACGVIAYELLMGKRPNPVDYAPLDISGVDSRVLEKLDAVIQEAIAYRVSDRFVSIKKMCQEWLTE